MRTPAAVVPLLLLLAACPGDITESIDPPGGDCDPVAVSGAAGLGCVPDRFTAEVSVRGTTAYTTTWGLRDGHPGNALYIWDVGPAAPVLVDSVIVANATTLGDVQVSDDGAWLVVATEFAPGSIVVFDLADPRHPVQASRFNSASTNPGVHTAEVARVDGRFYGFLSVDPRPGSPARLVIVDLGNPRAPVQVASLIIGSPFVHDVFVRDGLLFTALWNEGVRIYDIGGGGRGGTPGSPVAISTLETVDGAAHNLWWFHDPADGSRRYLFVGEEQAGSIGSTSEGDIHVVDISDLTAPREVAYFHMADAGTHNFSMDEASGILYAAYYNAGVQAINVRGDLGSCPVSQRDEHSRCDLSLSGRRVGHALDVSVGGLDFFVWGVEYRNGHVYASDMLNGLGKLNAPLPN
jgi:hypothetical protein